MPDHQSLGLPFRRCELIRVPCYGFVMSSVDLTPSVPVFVISFPEKAVRDEIRKRLAEIGVKPRFFDAVRGSTMSIEQRRPFLAAGREYWFKGPLRDGAMGCSMAHFGVWQTILDEGLEAAVVLEDDAVATPEGRRDLVARLDTLYQQRKHAALVFLHQRWNRPLVRVDGSRKGEAGLGVTRYSDLDALSYFITAPCVRYLLSRPERFRSEVDKYMHHWWRHASSFHGLVHCPPLFEVGGRPSQIGYDDEPRYVSNPMHHILMRRVHRIMDSVMKKVLFRGKVTRLKRLFASTQPPYGT